MTDEKRAARALAIDGALQTVYPDAVCALHWEGDPWRLMVMGRLSAQCTDARVNLVCEELFRRFPTPRAMADGDLAEIEDCVRSCGLYRVKAQNLKDASRMLCEEYGGKLPDSMEALLRFPGVGRKVANLILGDLYGTGGIVADTHCIRLCGRFGFYPEELKDPVKVERIMNDLVPTSRRAAFCHRLVLFGRDTCTARAPRCTACPLRPLCEHGRVLK